MDGSMLYLVPLWRTSAANRTIYPGSTPVLQASMLVGRSLADLPATYSNRLNICILYSSIEIDHDLIFTPPRKFARERALRDHFRGASSAPHFLPHSER